MVMTKRDAATFTFDSESDRDLFIELLRRTVVNYSFAGRRSVKVASESMPRIASAVARFVAGAVSADTPSAPTVSREATIASSGQNEREALPASLPALLLQAVEALEETREIARQWGAWASAAHRRKLEKAESVAAALRQRIGRE
jgi:hypothetical protein